MGGADRGRDALAQLVTAMLDQPDVSDLLVDLVAAAADVLGADLVAVSALDQGVTQVLAATTHDPARLEMLNGARHPQLERFDLMWCGQSFGDLAVLRRSAGPANSEDRRQGQAFADMAALAVVASSPNGMLEINERLQEVMRQRDTIEQAKGVLAYRLGIEPHAAYDVLVQRAIAAGQGVGPIARQVLLDALPPGGAARVPRSPGLS